MSISIVANAAGVYDSGLVRIRDNNENIKGMKIISEYDSELQNVLKKNKIIKNEQGPVNYQNIYSAEDTGGGFFYFLAGDEIDAQTLYESELAWYEMKTGINSVLNTIDIWKNNLLYEYFDEYVNTNFLLVESLQSIDYMGNNFYKEQNGVVAVMHQVDAKHKRNTESSDYGGNVKEVTGYKDFYELNGNVKEIEDIGRMLSIIYLWKTYSDNIIIFLGVVGLWVVIASLIKLLTRTG